MGVENDGDIIAWVTVDSPKPLSAVMREDLRVQAQRLIDKAGGMLDVRKLHKKCRARIPGSFERYMATVLHLMKQKRLRFEGRRARVIG